MYVRKLSSQVIRVGHFLFVRVDHLQQSVVAVVGPLGHVGSDGLVRHDQRTSGLGHFAHLAVEVFYGACSVLAQHQPADAVLRGVASAVVILHVVLRVVGVVDACQSVIFIVIGYRLAFLGQVGCLLTCHVAQSVVCECGLAAGRVVHFRAAVAIIICRGGHVAVSIGYAYKPLYAVVFERSGYGSVRTAFLHALQRLSAAARMSCLHIVQCVFHACHQCMAASFQAVCGLCLMHCPAELP